jgi:hypothetical protein
VNLTLVFLVVMAYILLSLLIYVVIAGPDRHDAGSLRASTRHRPPWQNPR